MHGVNLDTLGRRDPAIYGSQTLAELEVKVKGYAQELGLEATFSQTNHEGEFCELLHRTGETADALLLNPGAWTHYSYAIRDALEVAGLPAVEIHLSAIEDREEWRSRSVIRDLCVGVVSGKGVEGYRDGLSILSTELKATS
jgi:3-dehydroquinate dehydratase-2